MTADDFGPFYQAVHGFAPFPWQARLAYEVANRGWPAILALPTAAGKTSAIDVALFTLALQAGKSLGERTAPLRVFVVIDRRLVVDQAADHARRLKQVLEQALEAPDADPLVREVGRRLTSFGGPGPLHVAGLRGGMYRDDSWARAPNQPTVCVSTVDQVGSRLLFRGYGLSEFRRPVHAGLTGNDALYLIDEAHLSQPFLETLQRVHKYRQWAERPVPGPFVVVEMSATPHTDGERFGLSEGDRDNKVLRRRLDAPKPTTLDEPTQFEAEAVKRVPEAVKEGPARVVGVVVNRVASARRIFEALAGGKNADAILLTGRIRPWDRELLLGGWLGRMRAGRPRKPEDKPLFVVATQTVEVGADLDFDFLITEAAPLSALRQRFGRLDRLGEFGHAAGIILLRQSREADPIYGEDLTKTWDWLKGQARRESIDFGVNALDRLILNASEPLPSAGPRPAPVLLPAHLDAWVQTSPTPQPDPDVAPFLHGSDALEAADVRIIWRADLSWETGKERDQIEEQWRAAVAAARPVVLEGLPVSVGTARSWLRGIRQAETADVEGLSAEPSDLKEGRPRLALRWGGPDNSQLVGPGEVRPGDSLIVPSAYGGADRFGWHGGNGDGRPVLDVGDACFNLMADSAPQGQPQRSIRLRLHPSLYGQLLPEPLNNGDANERGRRLADFTTRLQAVRRCVENDQAGDYQDDLRQLLCKVRELVQGDLLMARSVDQFLGAECLSPKLYPGGLVLTRRVGRDFTKCHRPPPPELSDFGEGAMEDDTSSLLTERIPLKVHTDGVAECARRFGRGLGERLAQVVERAAQLHDLGKADPRFQTMLYGGDPLAAAAGELLAKSGMDPADTKAFRQAWESSGLPKRFRHEFVSVALARESRDELLQALSEEERELVEYLIGVHHGRGRPFVPFVEERDAEPVSLEWDGRLLAASPNHRLWRLGSGWTDLFWRLVRRHGYWGLAYLETVLVLADHARSGQEEKQSS